MDQELAVWTGLSLAEIKLVQTANLCFQCNHLQRLTQCAAHTTVTCIGCTSMLLGDVLANVLFAIDYRQFRQAPAAILAWADGKITQ